MFELDYFELLKFFVVEFMYNLFLGIVKRFFVYWVENEFFIKVDLELIGGRILELNVLVDIGRFFINIVMNYF